MDQLRTQPGADTTEEAAAGVKRCIQWLLKCCDQVFPSMQTATTMQHTPNRLRAGNGRARHWHRRWPSSNEGMGCTPSRCAICNTGPSE